MDKEQHNRLAGYFKPEEVKWKPQAVKGNRALAVAYIDARAVMRRLDLVMGPENWSTSFEELSSGSIMCKLSLRINGEWVCKADVGALSEQPDDGDKTKAAFSDALKRAAIQWGIGRYLYRLPHQWCDYDPRKRQLTQTPRLPDWALPKKVREQAPAPQPPASPAPQPPASPAPQPPASPAAAQRSGEKISWGEGKQIQVLLDECGETDEGFCQHYEIPSISQLPRDKYDEAMRKLVQKAQLAKARAAMDEATAAAAR